MSKKTSQWGQNNTKLDYGHKTILLLFCISILTFSSWSIASPSITKMPDIKELITPAAVEDVVYIQPFSLNEGYIHTWHQDQLYVKSGTLVVFKVNPDYVYPRNAAEPVLYVGNQTAQRLNHGHESGYVISIVPGEIDLSKELSWFGSPELPERVNRDIIANEKAMAERAEIKPFNAERVQEVTQKQVEQFDVAAMLRDHVAELVMKYSPQERALAETWRLPEAR